MPLPRNGMDWPPKPLASISPWLDVWSAWYSSDTTALEQLYSLHRGSPAPDRPSQYRGGLVGAMARTFWGAPRGDLTQPKSKLHVPVAADLCQASADLLYSEPPTLTVEHKATMERLTDLSGDSLHTTLAESAEIAAALGSVYWRVTWDRDIAPEGPFLTAVHADAAWPEFRWGRLVAVTFWHVVDVNGAVVRRHVERHELDPNGVGVILHGLYEGTADNLGRAVPLAESPATAGLARVVDDQSAISTGSPGLAVEYVRNQGPQRRWRKDPLGVNYGRSDLDGVEPLMDALDETYTSWMRDVRLGKARVFVARSLLDHDGPGAGNMWDADREVYAPLNALAPRDTSGLPIEMHQFAIRFAEHQATAEQLLGDILRTAGYSAQTFGEKSETVGVTATEVQSRERRSFMTRERKIRAQRPGLARIVEKLLAVDKAIWGTPGIEPARPFVEFADSVQDSLLTLGQTASVLRGAQAASTDTLVRLVHPEWDDEQVAAEIVAIAGENALADPTTTLPAGAESSPNGALSPDELAVMVQKIYLGVGTVLTSDEARQIINDAGGHLTGPGPQPQGPAGA